MRLWNPLAASVALGALLCCGTALARTWTDSSGKYKIEGEFVKLADGQVDIRRDDGKLVRIPLENLSEADQQYARKAAKPADESPFSATSDEAKPSIKAKSSAVGSDTQTVFAEGVGTTKEEALKDAFRAAVRQVVGEVVDGETLVKNEELVKDQVLTYSDGFIPEHKVTSEKRDSGLFRVSIRAKVQRRSVIMKLKAANITLKHLDGQSLYGSIVTQTAAEKDAAALVAKALDGFPENYLEARVVGDPRTLGKTATEATLVVNVEFAPSLVAYKTFAAKFCQTLEGSCKQKGEFTSVISKESRRQDERECFYIHSNQFPRDASKWMPEFWKTDRNNMSYGWAAKGFTFAVATLVSRDSSRVNWNYYLLDEAVGDAVLRAASRQVACKLSLVDADGQLVSVERFDPRNDRFPNLDAENTNDYGYRNSWRDFLAMVWGEESDYKGYLRPLDDERHDKWEPRLAFVGPLLFGSPSGYSGSFGYVPTFTVPRKVKLSLDELQKVAKVKCELAFRAGSDANKD